MIQNHTDLNVKYYVGEMGVDYWDKEKWVKEFSDNNVLVMTAQIFLNLLHHAYIDLSQVNLLIFDECHHAKKNHPYKQIMQFFINWPKDLQPKVMGLTASVVHGKVKLDRIESEIRDLEFTLRSTCVTSKDENVDKYAAKPKEEVLTFSENNTDEDTKKLIEILSKCLESGLDNLGGFSRDEKSLKCAKSALQECNDTLEELGPWAAYRVAGYLIKDLGIVCVKDVRAQNLLKHRFPLNFYCSYRQ